MPVELLRWYYREYARGKHWKQIIKSARYRFDIEDLSQGEIEQAWRLIGIVRKPHVDTAQARYDLWHLQIYLRRRYGVPSQVALAVAASRLIHDVNDGFDLKQAVVERYGEKALVDPESWWEPEGLDRVYVKKKKGRLYSTMCRWCGEMFEQPRLGGRLRVTCGPECRSKATLFVNSLTRMKK